MFKLSRPIQRIIEYPISAEYIDLDGNLLAYRCYVQMNYRYEVLDGVITDIETFNINGDPIPFRSIQTEGLLQVLKDHAADLALEKVESVDFEMEAENE